MCALPISIPIIAEQAAELTVFQRTPTYSVPAWNRSLTPEEVAEVKGRYQEFRRDNELQMAAYGSRVPAPERGALEVSEEERRAEYEARWQQGGLAFLGGFTDLLIDRLEEHTSELQSLMRNSYVCFR